MMSSCGFMLPAPAATHTRHLKLAPRRKRLPAKWPKLQSRHPSGKLRMTQNAASKEPVEDGVTLSKPADQTELVKQSIWLQNELTKWLNTEWCQSEHQPVHDEIGKRTGMIYTRQRMEGEDDLSSVMLAIGSELEGMDFSQAFVGPWNVANRAAELLLEHCAGERTRWRPSFQKAKRKNEENSADIPSATMKKRKGVTSPSLADSFERLKFLRDVLDGSASKELIDGAVAVVMGYRYEVKTGQWDGSQVEDDHFRSFGNLPPDILGDENAADMTPTLLYLDVLLGLDEDATGALAESLQTVVETLHGLELTKVQMGDAEDHAFRKRALVAKWLHLCGGF